MSWPLVKLDSLVEILSGFAFKSENFNNAGDGLPLVRIRDVVPGVSDTYYSGEYSSEFLLSDGDLLIGMDGDFNRAKWNGGRALLNQRVCKITAKSESLDQGYLYHFLPKALDKIHAETPAVTVKHLSVKGIRAIEIPLPPLAEQKRIAAILDKADAIRRKRQQAIELADEFLRSVFLDMFGDPVTNPKGFKTRFLSDFYIDGKSGTKCGPFGSALKKDEYTGSGIPIWGMDNITLNGEFIDVPSQWVSEEKYRELESYSLCQGDVIISRAGTVGKMGVVRSVSQRSLISTNLIRVRFGSMLLPEYFVSLMTYCKGRVGRLKVGPDGAFTHMNVGVLDTLEFPYPPIQLQESYLDIRRKVIGVLDQGDSSKRSLAYMFDAISQKTFRGEL